MASRTRSAACPGSGWPASSQAVTAAMATVGTSCAAHAAHSGSGICAARYLCATRVMSVWNWSMAWRNSGSRAAWWNSNRNPPGRRRPPRVGRRCSTRDEVPADGSTHWTTRSLAARLGIGKDAVARTWADHNLGNPRYTGRQVWNKQRKDEVLLDVQDVGLGYETRMRWNDPDTWLWSDAVVHEPLVSVEDFEAAQRVAAQKGHSRKTRQRERVRRSCTLRGLLICGLCGRRIQGQYSHDAAYYRCRYPNEYALTNHVQHPRNVYLAEAELLPILDGWLPRAFAPERVTDTIARLHAAQPAPPVPVAGADDVEALIAARDAKIARYRAIADAGGDPATIADWMAEVTAQRDAALAKRATRRTEANKIVRLDHTDIERLVGTLDDVRQAIRDADPAIKGEVYRWLRMKLTYHPGQNKIGYHRSVPPFSRNRTSPRSEDPKPQYVADRHPEPFDRAAGHPEPGGRHAELAGHEVHRDRRQLARMPREPALDLEELQHQRQAQPAPAGAAKGPHRLPLAAGHSASRAIH